MRLRLAPPVPSVTCSYRRTLHQFLLIKTALAELPFVATMHFTLWALRYFESEAAASENILDEKPRCVALEVRESHVKGHHAARRLSARVLFETSSSHSAISFEPVSVGSFIFRFPATRSSLHCGFLGALFSIAAPPHDSNGRVSKLVGHHGFRKQVLYKLLAAQAKCFIATASLSSTVGKCFIKSSCFISSSPNQLKKEIDHYCCSLLHRYQPAVHDKSLMVVYQEKHLLGLSLDMIRHYITILLDHHLTSIHQSSLSDHETQ